MTTIIVIVLGYICMCIETDIYVPTFPQMIQYYKIAENEIQYVLNINFAGLAIAGLITGPLSDSFGRRPVYIIGMCVFAISSIGCLFSYTFNTLLMWRFIQGLSSSVPMVVGYAIIMDMYNEEKSSYILGITGSIISTFMASAPLLGAWISQIFGWKMNFAVIILLSLFTLSGAYIYIEETLTLMNRRKFNFKLVTHNYIKLLSNKEFMAYSFLSASTFTCIIVYISNLSVIFINHLGMNLLEYSYWQAVTIVTYVLCSLLSLKLIKTKGLNYTTNFGYCLTLVGMTGLMITSRLDSSNILFISLSMACISGGGALFANITGTKAMSIIPEIKGAASAMITTLRLMLMIIAVIISEKFFDGTIVPVANIIISIGLVCIMLYSLICIGIIKG